MSTAPLDALRARLRAHADPGRRRWWENYVKDAAPFLGVPMGTIRRELHAWYRERVDGEITPAAQRDLALALLAGRTSEEKLAGILYMQELLLPAGVIDCGDDLTRFAALFDGGQIHDWNVCDWFCIKVLGPLIGARGAGCATRVAGWRDAGNLWRARAALVAFVPLAEERAYYPEIEVSCAVLIRRPERFAKTAVGWILREVAAHDPAFTGAVIDAHLPHFSSESLANATKRLDPATRARYRAVFRQTRREAT